MAPNQTSSMLYFSLLAAILFSFVLEALSFHHQTNSPYSTFFQRHNSSSTPFRPLANDATHHQQLHRTLTYSNSNPSEQQQQQQDRLGHQRRQQRNRAHPIDGAGSREPEYPASQTVSTVSLRESALADIDSSSAQTVACPRECDCNKVAKIADCSNRGLSKVPSGFPEDIKRIRLERNNITDLGPNAFQGLSRLQRIDLSNNNLQRIDPLAFSGGLQSLNSLILFSNKLSYLPSSLFSELKQLQLLLLNTNSIRCIDKELFQSLSNLNLLSLYDNNITTLANGTFDGLKNIKTIHLAKNPLACDCSLRWLADYLSVNPIETSEARCESPARNRAQLVKELAKSRFRCDGEQAAKATVPLTCLQQQQQLIQQQASRVDAECPTGCLCNGQTIDCSLVANANQEQSAAAAYELPEIPDNVPVYVTRMRINDQRIKRIRQTGLFKRLSSAQKLDLGNNRIIDIEDNTIGSGRPGERIVFVLLENESCSAMATNGLANDQPAPVQQVTCSRAPKLAPDNSVCFNGGLCIEPRQAQGNFSCACPQGFTGSLCEINIDDCQEHQCQNGAACVDGVNSYKCICRDPTTSGEFCEQLAVPSSGSFATSSANSINAPLALPVMMAPSIVSSSGAGAASLSEITSGTSSAIQTRSANVIGGAGDEGASAASCRRVTRRRYFDDSNGCQSVRMLKMADCLGSCGPNSAACCQPAKVKRRRIRMQCSDGASYVRTIELVKKCACNQADCPAGPNSIADSSAVGSSGLATARNNESLASPGETDHFLPITRLDAID